MCDDDQGMAEIYTKEKEKNSFGQKIGKLWGVDEELSGTWTMERKIIKKNLELYGFLL